jgi:hypothetical protein
MLPAIIPVVSALALTAPQVASLMVSNFAANVAVRATVERIARRSNVDNTILQLIADRLKTSDDNTSIGDVVRDLKNIVKAANAVDDEGTDRWTIEAVRGIWSELQSVAAGLDTALTTTDGGDYKGLADVLRDKELGLRDCTLAININPSDYLINGYAETWTMYS